MTSFHDNWPTLDLLHIEVELHSYSGESVPVTGTTEVAVKYGSQTATLPLLVVRGEGPSLLGRNWLNVLELNWQEIFWLHKGSLNQVLEKHKAVFEPGLGTVTGYQAKIIIDPNATPKYCKARTVPYAYREKVEKELDRLVEEGMLEPVEYSEWAAPMVAASSFLSCSMEMAIKALGEASHGLHQSISSQNDPDCSQFPLQMD